MIRIIDLSLHVYHFLDTSLLFSSPIPWLIGAEIFPSIVRAPALTISLILNWSCNFIVGVSFPHLNSYLTIWTFVPFGIILLLSSLFIMKYVPETRGKTLDEIQEEVTGIKTKKSNSDFDE